MTHVTPKQVRVQIAAASGMLDSLARRLPPAVHAANEWMLDPIPEGVNKREDAGVRAIGGHSDPTGTTALKELANLERVFELFEANLDTLKLCLVNLTQFADKWEPVENMEFRRCGQYTPRDVKLEEWYGSPNRLGRVPADCHDSAWYDTLADGIISWRSHGLCASCYSLRRDWLKRQSDVD